jgi:tetratricopeptide (TPR) repeat protein
MAKIKKRAPKRDLTAREEFRSIAEGVADFYRAHRNPFNIVLTAVVIVLVVMVGHSLISSNKEEQAGRLLDQGYQALEPGGGMPANYPVALQRFQDVVNQYGGTLSAAIAEYSVGNTYEQMGQHEQAVREYEKFTHLYGKEHFLLPFVYQRMGYAYLAMGKEAEAVKAFTMAETTGGAGPATVELARIYDREGKTADALKQYKVVSEQLSGTSWALEARTKLPPPDLQAPVSKPAGTAAK